MAIYTTTVRNMAFTLRETHKMFLDMVALPRRFPKGDRRNNQRAQVMCIANHQAKIVLLPPDKQRKHRQDCRICKVRVFKRGVVLQ